MKKLIICLLALSLFAGVKAQSSKAQLEGAKFSMIKKTVEFLSEDTAFKNVKSHTCEGCKTFNDLKKYAVANNLKNADSKVVEKLENTPIDTSAGKWQQSLQNFEQAAITQITGAGKEYRKQLNGYDAYTTSLDAIVAGVKGSSDTPESSITATADTAMPKDAANKTSIVANGAAQTSNIVTAALSWLPYIISAALLFAFIFYFLENRKLKTGKEHYKNKAHKADLEIQQKVQTIATLTSQKEKLEKELSDSELDRKSLEDRLKLLDGKKPQPKAAAQPAAPPSVAPAVTEKVPVKPVVQSPKPPANKIKYARYADMGDGFSNAELLDKPDGETIFELSIASNNTSGEYKVSSNKDAQHYALSNAQYFLGKTCQYDSFPSDNAVITTDAPGTVKLTGGKWMIVNPAKISFS